MASAEEPLSLIEQGIVAHEKFVADDKAMDVAYRKGELDEWLNGELERERQAYGGGNTGTTGEGEGGVVG